MKVNPPVSPESAISIHVIFANVQFLTTPTFVFGIILAQTKRCFGHHHGASFPVVAARRLEPAAVVHHAPEVLFSHVEALRYLPVELRRFHGSRVAAKDTGGVMDHLDNVIVRHFVDT